MVVDWSSQLWLGLPGLEGLPGLRMVGGWSSYLWVWFSGLYLHGMVEGKICWGHLGGVIAGSMKLIGLQKDVKLVINNIMQ